MVEGNEEMGSEWKEEVEEEAEEEEGFKLGSGNVMMGWVGHLGQNKGFFCLEAS